MELPRELQLRVLKLVDFDTLLGFMPGLRRLLLKEHLERRVGYPTNLDPVFPKYSVTMPYYGGTLLVAHYVPDKLTTRIYGLIMLNALGERTSWMHVIYDPGSSR